MLVQGTKSAVISLHSLLALAFTAVVFCIGRPADVEGQWLNSNVQNINNVRYASGFAGADAGTQIANAIANLPSAGGTVDATGLTGTQTSSSTITIPANVTVRFGQITLMGSVAPLIRCRVANCAVFGEGEKTVLKDSAGVAVEVGDVNGSLINHTDSLASDASLGATSIVLMAGEGAHYAAGNYIWIYNNNNTAGEVNVVSSISSDTLTLEDPLRYAYATALSTKVRQISWVTDTHLENFQVSQPSGAGSAVQISYALRPILHNITVVGAGATSARAIDVSGPTYGGQISNFKGESLSNAGIILVGVNNGWAISNLLIDGAGSAGVYFLGLADANSVTGGTIRHARSAVWIEGSEENEILGVISIGATNDAFTVTTDGGDSLNPPSRNSFVGDTAAGTLGPGFSILGSPGELPYGNVISGCMARSNSENGIVLSLASSTVISSCVLDNNGFAGTYAGLNLSLSDTGTVINGLISRNNTSYGVTVDSQSTGTKMVGGDVAGNASGSLSASSPIEVYAAIGAPSHSRVNSVSFSSAPTFDASLGTTQTITLTGNVTSSTLSNCAAGERVVFDIMQDAIGGRSFVWPTNVLNGGTIGSTASKHNLQTFYCDGTNARATAGMLINQN